MGPWDWGGGMGWWMLFGGVLWVAFWASLIYLAVSLFRGGSRRPDEQAGEPVDLAKRRYARGEISRDEYERIRKDLAA